MKYELKYEYKFEDNAKPKRHEEKVLIKTALGFELPDAPNDNRDFEDRTGKKQSAFEKDFQTETEKEIDKHYKEEVKNASQALRTPQDWKAYLKKFVAAEVAYVERRFDEEMEQLAKVAAKRMPDVISEKTLGDVEACALYLKEFPVKFSVSDKFFDDHMVDSIDSNTVKDAALDRYKKNKTTTSSWIELSKSTVLSKAGGGEKVAHVHTGKQQLGTFIKAKQWTATVSVSDWKPAPGKKMPKEVIEVKTQKDFTYLEVDIKKDDNYAMFVMGAWVPSSGKAEIYHYEARPPAASNMLAKYRKWRYNEGSKKYIGPVEST